MQKLFATLLKNINHILRFIISYVINLLYDTRVGHSLFAANRFDFYLTILVRKLMSYYLASDYIIKGFKTINDVFEKSPTNTLIHFWVKILEIPPVIVAIDHLWLQSAFKLTAHLFCICLVSKYKMENSKI